MAKYEDAYTLDCSIEDTIALFHVMAQTEFPNWSISSKSTNLLVLKEPHLAVIGRAYPTTVEVHLAAKSPNVTEVQLKGSCFGLGPLNVREIKKRVDKMRNLTERAVNALKMQIRKGVLCPSCGQSVALGTRFCGNCGSPIASVCPKCNHPNAPGAHFCINCGAELG